MSYELRKKFWRLAIFMTVMSLLLVMIGYLLGDFKPSTGLLSKAKNQAFDYYSQLQSVSKSRVSLADKQKAAIVILCRNEDLDDLKKTLENFETRFNKDYAYPYVLLNDKPFESKFERSIKKLVKKGSGADVIFARIPQEHWSFPPWIDQEKAAQTRKDMAHIMYGGSESYRHMCRYYSGFFFQHPILQQYKYYWRIEPGVKYLCNIPYDPFVIMEREQKKYGFILSFPELAETVPTLMNSTIEFQKLHSELLNKDNNWFSHFQRENGEFNLCHFWSNFEIGSFDFLRSPQYKSYFDFLDRKGGFFYERWGDAPVHSLAVGMFLRHDEVLYFKDIGYHHPPINHCPVDEGWRKRQDCDCVPEDKWDRGNEWCLKQWISYAHKKQ